MAGRVARVLRLDKERCSETGDARIKHDNTLKAGGGGGGEQVGRLKVRVMEGEDPRQVQVVD